MTRVALRPPPPYCFTMETRVWALALSLVLAACGGSDSDTELFGGGDAGSSGACVPGQSVACIGPAGCEGGQVCRDDGAGFEACECEAGDAGADADEPADAADDAPAYPGMPGDGCTGTHEVDLYCSETYWPRRYQYQNCRHPWPDCIQVHDNNWCCER